MASDNPLKVRRLSEGQWGKATEEERLAHVLSGGALRAEQAREIVEQIYEDLTHEKEYLLSLVPGWEGLLPESRRGPSVAGVREANVPSSLSPQPSHTLLTVEDAWRPAETAVPSEELLRLRVARLREIKRIQQALKSCLDSLSDRKSKSRRTFLPKDLPQQTCMEVRNAAIAVADGRTLRRWSEVEGENSLDHEIPGDPIHTRLSAGVGLDWWGLPATYVSLRDELRKLELPAVLLLNIMIGGALKERHVTVAVDELIGRLGWNPHSAAARDGMRRKIWRWILIFDSMKIYGKRPGVYIDRRTKKAIDLTSADALVKLTGVRGPTQPAFDNSSPPIEVSWVVGPWLDRFRDNKQVLQFFGEVDKLAAIPAGKPTGTWAQSIGLALNQLWRERARRATATRAGENNRLTVIFDVPFTRYELLDMFRAAPWVEDILYGDNPSRAQQYWDGAIRILKRGGVINHYKEKSRQITPQRRLGWQEDWLHQELDIRPKDEWVRAVADLAKKSAIVSRILGRERAPKARG
jgi:hypothetical protein